MMATDGSFCLRRAAWYLALLLCNRFITRVMTSHFFLTNYSGGSWLQRLFGKHQSHDKGVKRWTYCVHDKKRQTGRWIYFWTSVFRSVPLINARRWMDAVIVADGHGWPCVYALGGIRTCARWKSQSWLGAAITRKRFTDRAPSW